MKKLLLVVLSVIMIFSITACNGGTQDNSSPPAPAQDNSSPSAPEQENTVTAAEPSPYPLTLSELFRLITGPLTLCMRGA